MPQKQNRASAEERFVSWMFLWMSNRRLTNGFYFRKCIGLGPLALNFSKSGIGISAGVRGLRAGLSIAKHPGIHLRVASSTV